MSKRAPKKRTSKRFRNANGVNEQQIGSYREFPLPPVLFLSPPICCPPLAMLPLLTLLPVLSKNILHPPKQSI